MAWYWYVPRALRNGAYAVFVNGKRARASEELVLGHGHSAVIAPDGTFILAAGEEVDKLFITTIDISKARRAEAIRRHEHPCFRRFWDLGLEIMAGAEVLAPPFEPLASPSTDIILAVAQIACSRDIPANLERMGRLVEQARSGGADGVVFPALSVTGAVDQDIRGTGGAMLDAALARLQAMARQAGLYILFGMPYVVEGGQRYNSAFALSPQGALLTRYDQLVLDRPELFSPGLSTRSMWFEVKGVPAVVTIGRDALWSELAELAAVRGALLHFHLDYVNDASPEGRLLRRQLWANLATFRTFTATVNAAAPGNGAEAGAEASAPASGGSMLWQDFYWQESSPEGGPRRWVARPLAEAGAGEQVIFARQSMPRLNMRFSQVPGLTNPQMQAWFVAGAQAIYE